MPTQAGVPLRRASPGQLREIWQLTPESEPGSLLVPPLQAKLIDTPGGELRLDGDDVWALQSSTRDNDGGFEKAFGPDGRSRRRSGSRRCSPDARGVQARIENQFEEGVGTGFLVAGGELTLSYPACVLVTNAHVIPAAVQPDEARITFRGLPGNEGSQAVGVSRVLARQARGTTRLFCRGARRPHRRCRDVHACATFRRTRWRARPRVHHRSPARVVDSQDLDRGQHRARRRRCPGALSCADRTWQFRKPSVRPEVERHRCPPQGGPGDATAGSARNVRGERGHPNRSHQRGPGARNALNASQRGVTSGRRSVRELPEG